MIEVRAHFQSPNPTLKEVKFADLKKATKNFSMHVRIPPTYVGRVFLAWVEQNTLAPSKERDGIAVAVKRHIPFDKWLAEKNILGQLACLQWCKLNNFTGRLTTKSDIYGFGVMLLESITGRRVFFLHENQTLVDWATGIHTNKRNVKEIIDPRLEDNYSLQSVSECFSLAVRCVSNNPADRPSSEEVLQNLERIHALYK
ncbi:probable serine/threonine-protein kinase PBL11 [Helianthus annuus]|uniref:probable serine/threonine-protein kinase PBL11 n=1 Tax=Helianthus annuus TaxID=4232 RepID=UPI0016530EBA|nr:probable serine/threonine-protein kinase PBL11 [Helianthus annuus]